MIAIFKYYEIKYENYVTLVFFTLYGGEHYCLSLSFFINLYYIFRESIIGINSKTKYIFIAIFTCQPIIILSTAILEIKFRGTVLWYCIFALNYILLIIVCISIVILYVYKLVIVYTVFNKDIILIKLITKTSILAITSIIFSLITIFLMIYKYGTNTDIFYVHAITSIDILTNFLCIMLGFQYFENHYNKLCGLCLHKQCELCWVCIVDKLFEKKQSDTISETKSDISKESNPTNSPSNNIPNSTVIITDNKSSNLGLKLQQNTLSLTVISSNPSIVKLSNMNSIVEEITIDVTGLSLKDTKSSLHLPCTKLAMKEDTLSFSVFIPNNNMKTHTTSSPVGDPEITPDIIIENDSKYLERINTGCNSVTSLNYEDFQDMNGTVFVH
eukprot:496945_1